MPRLFRMPARGAKQPTQPTALQAQGADALSPAALRAAADTCETAARDWRDAADKLERLEGMLAEQATWLGGAPAQAATREHEAAIALRVQVLEAAMAVTKTLAALSQASAD